MKPYLLYRPVYGIYLVIISVFLTWLGFQFAYQHVGLTMLNLFLGFALSVGIAYGFKVLPFVFIPHIIIGFLLRFYAYDVALDNALLMTLGISIITLIQLYVARYLIEKIRVTDYLIPPKIYALYLLVVMGVIISLIGTTLLVMVYLIVQGTLCTVSLCYAMHFIGSFFGIILIVPVFYFASVYDGKLIFKPKNLFKYAVFTLGFLLMMTVFATVESITLNEYGYLIIILYIIGAFVLSYRAFLFFIAFGFLFSGWFYLQSGWDGIEFFDRVLTHLVFTMINVYIAVIIKVYYAKTIKHLQLLKETNAQLDQVIDSVYELLSLSKDVLGNQNVTQSNYEQRVFEIALSVFRNYSAAYSVIITPIQTVCNQRVNYTDDIPYFETTLTLFKAVKDDVLHFPNVKASVEKFNETQTMLHQNHALASRTMMRFNITADKALIVVLDYFEPHAKYYEQLHRQFVQLLNQLFKKNYLISNATTLKNDIILSFVKTLELYDPYTKGHGYDVAIFSKRIAEKLALSAEHIDQIYWAGVLHDIGKIGVDYEIVNKPSKLTDAEYAAVKKHVDYGVRVLEDASHLKQISEIVGAHHEWWNGLGYPNQRKEDSIPIGAQILSVADAVGTMATDRPYRDHLSKAKILQEIIRFKGTQFSPVVVDIMVELIEDGFLESHYKRTFN